MMSDLPKQFLSLDDMPVLAHTLAIFEEAASIGRIILVVPKEGMKYAREEIVFRHKIRKVDHIRAGGEKRQDSVRNGLEVVEDRDDVVVIHDGVRPFVSQELIDRSVLEASRSGAVVPVIPLTDTVKIVGHDGLVIDTPDRNNLRFAQTPQTFKREIILEAYQNAFREGFYGTDDASLVERMGVSVKTIPGSHDNIKITTPEDIIRGTFLLKKSE